MTIMYRISTAHMADKQDAMFVSGIFRMRSMHIQVGPSEEVRGRRIAWHARAAKGEFS